MVWLKNFIYFFDWVCPSKIKIIYRLLMQLKRYIVLNLNAFYKSFKFYLEIIILSKSNKFLRINNMTNKEPESSFYLRSFHSLNG